MTLIDGMHACQSSDSDLLSFEICTPYSVVSVICTCPDTHPHEFVLAVKG